MASLIDAIFRRQRQAPPVPVCPDHKVEMHMRGKMGKPARFTGTTEEQYTVLYFCPVPECNHTAEVTRRRIRIAVPGEPPVRPVYARDGKQ